MEHGSSVSVRAKERAVEHVTPQLLERVVDSLTPEGSIVLLVGASGSGKSRLAQDAVDALSVDLEVTAELVTIMAPSNPLSTIASRLGVEDAHGAVGVASFSVHPQGEVIEDTERIAEQLMKLVQTTLQDPGSGPLVLLVQGIDQYSPGLAMLIDKIARNPRVRVVATARGLNAAAAHLASNSRANTVSVPPLTMEESSRYLVRLLGVERIEFHSLRRWYRVTEGNALSVMLMALGLDSEGRIGRSRGVAYELPGPAMVPREFGAYLRDSCTDEELRTLETIALAEPLGESVLIRTLDPTSLSALRSRGILKAQHRGGSGSQLSLSHKLLAAAVVEQMSEERLEEVSGELFDLLRAGTTTASSLQQSLLLRLVTLGLNAHRILPNDWLIDALASPPNIASAALRLRIARTLLHYPDVSTTQFATAALCAVRLARESGEDAVLERSWEDVRAALARLRRTAASTTMLRIRLELELARHYAFDMGDLEAALAMMDTLERELSSAPSAEQSAIQSERVMLYAASGDLQAAWRHLPDPDSVSSMPIEWERAPARIISSLLLGQHGEFASALRVSDRAASYALMGERPQTDLARSLQFASFINFWRCGATEAARYSLEGMLNTSQNDQYFVGYVELAASLMSLSDGKWGLAVQRAERLVDRLAQRDPYGLASLAHAAHALGLAALGEKEGSRRAIRAAETQGTGLAQAVLGYVRVLTLRARQWNMEDNVAVRGLKLAAWASAEGLPTVELLALHIVAMEERVDARGYLSRIREAASKIEPPMSAAILAHCEELIEGKVAWESPGARRLTELGIWMPLPDTDELSAREREVAMFASLGYSSRWIAEQFHLSVRTVDTHLRHVFTKLQVSGRDELRHWFRREHQTW
ncbi:LuxR C-terminal-related transcriptional regulator [Leucobacter salsicius]|uniref:LuxR C-terminal-related transcriptional regulator n=1 Tax=Leucobacter salsicius TaxID=664638 RepID=UPI000374CC91|nr:LuxR C-terminal-related transcriptional regulator [Leucobacter salsicius]